ncbi:MAG: hypothetical protein GXY44_02635 [Phycisphaerales bacterium]|nr:hypothetical protein [Phycisphaerales bacterium]
MVVRAHAEDVCGGSYASYSLPITVFDCLEAADCDDDGDPCTDAACEANVCVHNLKDCGDGFCKPDTGECVECLEEDNCGEENPFCVDNVCVECIEDANCDDDDLCTNDACVDNACVNEPVDCGDGVCDPENGECVECLVNDDCPRWKICTEENECIWYWETGGGPAPIIPGGGDDDDDDEAVECVEDADCEDGDLCTINICADDACVTLPVECAEDEICDPDTGECFTDPDSGQPIPEPGDDDDDDADDDDDDDDAPAGKCGLLGFGQMGMMLTGLTLMRVSRRRRNR